MLGNITCKLQTSNSSWLALSNVPSLTFIASQDTDALQLESCRENHRHLRVEVETHLADASFEDGLPIPSCSVDKLMTAPPLGSSVPGRRWRGTAVPQDAAGVSAGTTAPWQAGILAELAGARGDSTLAGELDHTAVSLFHDTSHCWSSTAGAAGRW